MNCPMMTVEVFNGPPVDYSFKGLTEVGGAAGLRPRAFRLRKAPGISCSGRFLSRSIWLNNNCLKCMSGTSTLVNSVLHNPAALGWIDFSHNYICDVHPDLLKFPNLRILYLHGNLINSLCAVYKLRSLRCLRTLTLHGNPVETVRSYRLHVVNMLPQLLNLDFAPIVQKERRDPVPPGHGCRSGFQQRAWAK